MRIKVYAVGTKMPAWVEQGCQHYLKRMPREIVVQFTEFPLIKRQKNANLEKVKNVEGAQMLNQIGSRETVVALEVGGRSWTTQQVAQRLTDWQESGNDAVLLIGGPDGLSDHCLQRADSLWSLSSLTLPHPLVRVILAEQLYRAWSILRGHPYHRE